MTAIQTKYARKYDRRWARQIDPNTAHEFIENDYDVRCWRCEQPRNHYLHRRG